MTVFMFLAAAWGVLQLAVLGWFGGRTVRLGTLLAALAVGLYWCGATSILLQVAYTRSVASITGEAYVGVVNTAGYSVDPFIEEIVKVAPLLLLGMVVRIRRQWGLTDFVLAGAALGAGFGLMEAVLRFSHRPSVAIGLDGGWVIPSGFSATFVPGPFTILTSWLPAPATSDLLSFSADPQTYLHLVWSAVAGLGAGVILRGRGVLRLLGIAPVALVGGMHAAANYDLTVLGRTHLGDALAAPFLLVSHALGLLPLVALGIAAYFDRRDLLLAPQRLPDVFARGDSAALAGFAFASPLWTVPIALRFTRARRSLAYATRHGTDDGLRVELARLRQLIGRAGTASAWRATAGPGEVRLTPRWLLLGFWLVLVAPAVVYFVLGDFRATSFLQDLLSSALLSWVMTGLLAIGVLWLAWQVAVGVRGLPAAGRSVLGETTARARLRILGEVGAIVAGAYALFSALRGTALDRRPPTALHSLSAWQQALVITFFALALGSMMFFPPGGLVLAGFGVVAAEDVVALSAAGTLGVVLEPMLANAADSVGGNSGNGGGDSGDGTTSEQPEPPSFDEVEIDSRKITDYAMNPEHATGANKFRVINSRTGLGPADAASVEQQIREGVQGADPIVGELDQFGQRWNVDVPLTGPDGTMTVRTAWIVDPGASVPRLITISFP